MNPTPLSLRASAPVFLAAAVVSLTGAPFSARAESLQERQTKILQVFKNVSPAVVAISGAKGPGRYGSGSGVIISKEGLVLTAGHVVASTGDELRITLADGRNVTGKALGRDMDRDAALVQITEPGEYAHVDMAAPESVERGEWVVALGHPGGFDIQRGAPLRAGRLWDADTKAYFRSDCTVSGGDSGGPLFDLDGKVVGIHSSISQDVAENRHVPIGVFAEDMERLKKGDRWGKLSKLMPDMKDFDDAHGTDEAGDETRPEAPRRRNRARPQQQQREEEPAPAPAAPAKGQVYLGVQLETLSNGGGVLVVEVTEGSPAEKSGLQLEDIITKVNGQKTTENADVVSTVRASKPGDKLKFTVTRKGAEQEVEVTLGQAP